MTGGVVHPVHNETGGVVHPVHKGLCTQCTTVVHPVHNDDILDRKKEDQRKIKEQYKEDLKPSNFSPDVPSSIPPPLAPACAVALLEVVPIESSKKRPKGPTDGSLVFQAYVEAMEKRWNVTPPRSAAVSSMAKSLIARVGIDNAIALAKYFPTRLDPAYIKCGHPFEQLLKHHMVLLGEISTGVKRTSGIIRRLSEQEATLQSIDMLENGLDFLPIGPSTQERKKIAATATITSRCGTK